MVIIEYVALKSDFSKATLEEFVFQKNFGADFMESHQRVKIHLDSSRELTTRVNSPFMLPELELNISVPTAAHSITLRIIFHLFLTRITPLNYQVMELRNQ